MHRREALLEAIRTIRNTAQQMQGNSKFRCVFDEYALMSQAELREWETVVSEETGVRGYQLPPPLIELYECTGGFKLHWQLREGSDRTINGLVELASPLEIFQSDEEESVSPTVFKTPRVLDRISDTEHVTMDVTSRPQDELLLTFRDLESRSSFPLSLDPLSYLVELAEHRGIYGWQKLFAAESRPEQKDVIDAQLRAVLEALGERTKDVTERS